MKNYISLFLCAHCSLAMAQTNTFPASGNVGIGTTETHNAILTVNGDSYNGIRIENDTPGREASLRLRSKNGSGNMFHADLSSYRDGARGYIGFKVPSNNAPGSGYKLIVNDLGNVGIGTTDPDEKLAVNGNIHAKEVRVDLTGWPDYVFTKGYDLPTLEEVERHIQEKGHLINIPSAKVVEENGIQLGEMNKLLLEKIEELTLYILEQEEKLHQKDIRIKRIEAENFTQEIRLQKIEKHLNQKR